MGAGVPINQRLGSYWHLLGGAGISGVITLLVGCVCNIRGSKKAYRQLQEVCCSAIWTDLQNDVIATCYGDIMLFLFY